MDDHPQQIPPPLSPGDKIGIIALSSYPPEEYVSGGVSFLEGSGFKVIPHPQTKKRYGQFAGTIEDKTRAIHEYFKDSSIKAIMNLCGGNGALHLLDKIDYRLIKQNPKFFMGFSDTTALLNAIYAKTRLVTYHGASLCSISRIKSQDSDQTINTLLGKKAPIQLEGVKILNSGTVKGHLIGGNLSVLQALIGTDYAPPTKNAILFLEDVGDHINRYDRMLGHMRLAGWLNNISAVILGNFTNTKDSKTRPFGFTIEEILTSHLGGRNIPVVANTSFGHEKGLPPFPIGQSVTLHAENEKNAIIEQM